MNLEIVVQAEEVVVVKPEELYALLEKEIYCTFMVKNKKMTGKAYEVLSRGIGCMEAYFLGNLEEARWKTKKENPGRSPKKYLFIGRGMTDPRSGQPTAFLGEAYRYNPLNNTASPVSSEMILKFTERVTRKVYTVVTFEKN